MFDGSLGAHPVRLTVVQSVIVTVLATVMSVTLYLTLGVNWPGVWYQVFATLLIASILAPVFLYPSFRVASQLLAANRRIREQAYTDQLTGLPNSFALNEELGRMAAERTTGFAVHFVDINRFKAVNAGLGHEAGDELIVAFARRLQDSVGDGTFVARFGGDEFVVLQPTSNDALSAASDAEKLVAATSGQYGAGASAVRITTTVGSAIAPTHGGDAPRVLKAANLALQSAKEKGSSYELFNPSLATAAAQRRDTERGLQTALRNGDLFLLYQPIVSTRPGNTPVSFEALMRWKLPDGTVAMPDTFIPVAESTGMIVEMGRWALQTACADCANWSGDVRVAVNVSPVQIRRADFVDNVETALRQSGLDPRRLELEITETVLITEISVVGPTIEHLRQLGVRVALDDFGAGYAGLNYLRRLVIDKIKVDKSIIDDAIGGEKAANILRGVAKIASESGLAVTIEGVDTFEKVDFITRERCADEMQGFLFGRPLDRAMIPLVIAPRQEPSDRVVRFPRK